MEIRQSHLQQYNRCPESFRLKYVVGVKGRQSAAASYGTVLHYAIQTYWLNNKDLDLAKRTFEYYWNNPDALGCAPEYYLRATSWSGYLSAGRAALDSYGDAQVSWCIDDLVLGIEIPFKVPVGTGHTLTGTMDILRIKDKKLDIADIKSGKVPTYLRYHVQFTSYVFATLQDEFWDNIEDGDKWRKKCRNMQRTATWIDMKSNPFKEISAGTRVEADFIRLGKAVDALAKSIDLDVFVPTLSGTTCSWCDFYDECGLPEGNLLTLDKAPEISYEKDHFDW